MNKQWMMAGLLLLSGCAMAQSTSQRGMLMLKPQILSGPYSTTTLISPYTQSSINHLILKLYTFDGTEHDQNYQKTIPNAYLSNPIVLSNLKANTTYRFKAYAYASTDESALISTTDASSSTDITLTNDEHPTIASFKVQLIAQPFNGQATASGVVVTPGGYSNSGPETSKWLTPDGLVTTVAGNGLTAFADGTGTTATFYYPQGITLDPQGNLYVVDSWHYRIRKIDSSGVVTTIAGNGNTGNADGTGTAAQFNRPCGIVQNSLGNLYVADSSNNLIRKISATGVVTTFVGNGGAGFADGTGTAATLNNPAMLAIDSQGNMYLAEAGNHRIRKITPTGAVTTIAGNGNAGHADGTGTAATFKTPQGIAVDNAGTLYVADTYNHLIRKISSAGVVTTIGGNCSTGFSDGQGTTAAFSYPGAIVVDPYGNLYITDAGNNRIRKINPSGFVTTLAGNGNSSFADGAGSTAAFANPNGLTIDALGNLYITDQVNNRVRKVQ